jgi:hypothetical protein
MSSFGIHYGATQDVPRTEHVKSKILPCPVHYNSNYCIIIIINYNIQVVIIIVQYTRYRYIIKVTQF